MTDNLHNLGACALGKFVCSFANGKIAAVLQGALDKLMRFEGLFGLLNDTIIDVAAAYVDDGVEVMSESAQLTHVFSGKGHGWSSLSALVRDDCYTIA